MAVNSTFGTSPLERLILSDLREKAGIVARRLGGIDTQAKAIADAALPVLAAWVEKIDDASHRHAVYALFYTRHAYPYLDRIISWWTTERDSSASASLTQSLALLVKALDAERVWQLCKSRPPRPFHYLLLSKLAGLSPVQSEVKDVLSNALRTESLAAGDLAYIATVDDDRIRSWFRAQVDSPDPSISSLSKRLVAKSTKLPAGMSYVGEAPDRTDELHSAELDVALVADALSTIEKRFGLRLPRAVRSGAFLSAADVNRWMRIRRSTRDGKTVSLWLRLEDVDVAEAVLIDESSRLSNVSGS